MAARLMCLDAAQNGVLCDEKTYKACQSVINFEDLGTAKVKGKAYPIAIYRPLSIKNRGDNQQPSCDGKTMLAGPLDDKKKKSTVLIGRKKEMALIEKVLTDYASGKAATLIMEGTTGSGISSMGNFVLERAEAKHINTWYDNVVVDC